MNFVQGVGSFSKRLVAQVPQMLDFLSPVTRKGLHPVTLVCTAYPNRREIVALSQVHNLFF